MSQSLELAREKMIMDDIDELLEAFRTLYADLETLRLMEGPEFLLPGRVEAYHRMLEDAYTAFGTIETRVDELGQQLEAECNWTWFLTAESAFRRKSCPTYFM